MIIEFSNEIEDLFINDKYTDNDLKVLQSLFTMFSNEKNYLKLSEKFIMKILFDKYIFESFSRDIRRLINDLYARYSTIKSEYKKYNSLVVLSSTKTIKKIMNEINIQYEVPFNSNVENLFAILSTENVQDYHFYMGIYKMFNDEKIYIDNLPYNGGNIDTIKTYIHNNKVLLCIADSDKEYFDSKKGSTASAVERLIKKYETKKIIDKYVLNVREKENLIPFSTYLIYCESTKEKYFKEINNLANMDNNINYYYDIKDGIKLKKYNEYYNKFDTDECIKWNQINRKMIDAAIDNELSDFNVCLDERCIKGALDVFNRIEVDIEKNDEKVKNIQFYPLQLEDIKNINNKITHFGIVFDKSRHFNNL